MTTPDDLGELGMRDEECERALVAAALRWPDQIATVLAKLPGSDFYSMGRGTVWDACRELSAAKKLITPTTVGRHLEAAGLWSPNGQGGAVQHVVQHEMWRGEPTAPQYAAQYAELITDLARRREVIQLASRIRRIAIEHQGGAAEVLTRIEAEVEKASSQLPDDDASDWETWEQMHAGFVKAHTELVPRLVKTPWPRLNDLIGGLFGGRMYVIGGAPGDGKSSAALNLAFEAAHCGQPTLVFSAEMPALDVFGRLVSHPAQVSLGAINRYRLTEAERDRIDDFATAQSLPLRVNASSASLGQVERIARAHKYRHGLTVLVVDYLQLIRLNEKGRTSEEEIARISTALKQLSMELDCAVVVPAQLNRQHTQRADQRPTKSDLRGSGRIEQDADVVILLHHEQVDGVATGEVTMIVDKNRHGPKGDVSLDWRGEYGAMR